jgi:glycosyltransferase domain-containing protein
MISILLPTYNRPDFLTRLLNYYANFGIDHHIIIADSSDSDKKISPTILESLEARGLNFEYQYYPHTIIFFKKLLKAIERINTKYVVLAADDDFFVPGTLANAVQFLETSPDYSVCHGEAINFLVEGDANGMISSTERYNQRSFEQASGAERLLSGLKDYSTTWYSVHKTNLFLENIKQSAELTNDYLFFELVLFSLDLIQGKVKKIDRLYMARQGSNSSTDRNYKVIPTVFDWMLSPHWSRDFNRIQLFLAKQIVQNNSVDYQEALLIIRDAFLSYLNYHIVIKSPYLAKLSTTKTVSENHGFREKVEQIPGLKPAWQMVKNLFSKKQVKPITEVPYDEMSLDNLLTLNSPYHADFLPIYQAITNLQT